MGYSRSVATVIKRKALLLPLFRGEHKVVWHTTPDQAPKRAYEIRECLAIARHRPDQLPELAQLAEIYTVYVRGNLVVAERRSGAAPTPTVVEPSSEPVRVPYVDSSAAVIQHWIDSQPGSRMLEFTVADLSESDLGEVVRFGASIEPPWEVVHAGKMLTLRPEAVSL